jgi:carbamoyl-phosphate synthase large subunit
MTAFSSPALGSGSTSSGSPRWRGQSHGADHLAPALYHADVHALVPRIDDPDYIPALCRLVAEHDVRLIVPLTDLDHVLLAGGRESLAPAIVLLPETAICETVGDKYLAHLLFTERGVPSPRSWLPDEILWDARYPLMIKAREGFGSRNICRCEDAEELAFFLRLTRPTRSCRRRSPGTEFSIDVFCDRESRCLNAIPRTMIQSKGGESIKGMTIKDWELIEHGRMVAETVGIVGPANIQCFREPDGSLPVTDINPRFGGAFPLPRAAGSHYPELAVALANGLCPEPRLGEFHEGIVMTRFFSHLSLKANEDGVLEPYAEELPKPIAALGIFASASPASELHASVRPQPAEALAARTRRRSRRAGFLFAGLDLPEATASTKCFPRSTAAAAKPAPSGARSRQGLGTASVRLRQAIARGRSGRAPRPVARAATLRPALAAVGGARSLVVHRARRLPAPDGVGGRPLAAGVRNGRPRRRARRASRAACGIGVDRARIARIPHPVFRPGRSCRRVARPSSSACSSGRRMTRSCAAAARRRGGA